MEKIQNWFVQNGLPLFLPRKLRRQDTLARVAPFTVFVIVAQISVLATSALMSFISRSELFAFLDREPTAGETEVTIDLFAALVALATLLVPLIGLILAFIIAYLSNKLSAIIQKWIAVASIVLFIFLPLIARAVVSFEGVFSSNPVRVFLGLLGRSAIVALWLWVVISGLGAIATYAYRQARRQLPLMGAMALKALPLVVLTLLFSYLATETWQITARMNIKHLLGVILLLFGLALALTIATTSERLNDLLEKGIDARKAQKLLENTPLTVGSDAHKQSEINIELTKSERTNLVLLQVSAGAWQATLFGIVVFIFLMALSLVAMPAAVETSWTTLPSTPLSVNGVILPITWAQIKVALFLSAFAALTFTASSSTEESYRQNFREPLNEEVERALAAKHYAQKIWNKPQPVSA